ncbi:hypothetical protein [Pedobacter aquatilis]|uniref:hypothetical protein n=1 Tax=Pedobacter aquatilis TaxID=351343 RepID=UPI00292EC84A|nr:hypothetical protein [Pedobacter aquatilis]
MNYIIKHTGAGKPNLDKVRKVIQALKGHLIDGSSLPKMGLVKIEPQELDKLKHELEGFNIFPEKSYKIPTTVKKPHKTGF